MSVAQGSRLVRRERARARGPREVRPRASRRRRRRTRAPRARRAGLPSPSPPAARLGTATTAARRKRPASRGARGCPAARAGREPTASRARRSRSGPSPAMTTRTPSPAQARTRRSKPFEGTSLPAAATSPRSLRARRLAAKTDASNPIGEMTTRSGGSASLDANRVPPARAHADEAARGGRRRARRDRAPDDGPPQESRIGAVEHADDRAPSAPLARPTTPTGTPSARAQVGAGGPARDRVDERARGVAERETRSRDAEGARVRLRSRAVEEARGPAVRAADPLDRSRLRVVLLAEQPRRPRRERRDRVPERDHAGVEVADEASGPVARVARDTRS